jgi:hypothetical protein
MCKYHALVVRAACNPLRWYHLASPSPSSPAASTPQNLTSGRRLSRLAPKFLILEVIGLERAEPIFITASCSQDVMRRSPRSGKGQLPSRMAGFSLTLRAGSGRFEHSPLRHFSLDFLRPAIQGITINPTWTIPHAIVESELIPKLKKDPHYLSRAKLVVLDGNGRKRTTPRSRPSALTSRTLGASIKQVFYILLQIRDDLMMAFNHLIPCKWVMGKNTALSEKLNVLAYLF